MSDSAVAKLLALLNAEGRELVNIKFFPGSDRGLTVDELCTAATAAINSAFAKGLVDAPPVTGLKKQKLAN